MSTAGDNCDTSTNSSVLSAWGLEIFINAIEGTDTTGATSEIREDISQGKSIISSWELLLNRIPQCGLHPQMVHDVLEAVESYKLVKATPNPPSPQLPWNMTVVDSPASDNVHEVGSKGIGGLSWKTDKSYANLLRSWNGLGLSQIPPCPVFIWTGMIRKIVFTEHLADITTLQMLSSVDYDFDRNPKLLKGFYHAIDVARKCVLSSNTHLKSAALAALLSYDIQKVVREYHENWIAEQNGAFNFGAKMLAPKDWIDATVGDCAGLGPYGYQDADAYDRGKAPMFFCMVLANSHDFLYDRCSHNRMSSLAYAAASTCTKQDLHTVFVRTGMDAVAGRVLHLADDEFPLYGDSASLCTAAWTPFNGRYRTWERLVKYMRQIQEDSPVLEMSKQQLIFEGFDLEKESVASLWQATVDLSAINRLVPRNLLHYDVHIEFDEILLSTQNHWSQICAKCRSELALHMTDGKYPLWTAVPLQRINLESQAVKWAVGISRLTQAAIETSYHPCAISVGTWADEVSYNILVKLMEEEANQNPREWLLTQYAVWCTTTAPISVATILSGFDLGARIRAENGAMGVRDAAEC